MADDNYWVDELQLFRLVTLAVRDGEHQIAMMVPPRRDAGRIVVQRHP